MKLFVVLILATLIVPFSRAEAKGLNNPFVGKWCAAADNDFSSNREISFERDQTMRASHSSGETVWHYAYNPDSRLVIGNPQFRKGPNGLEPHPESDDGIGVLFEISPEGRLVWLGPVFESDFMSIDQSNMEKRLLMDARIYKMTYEPCEHFGY